MKKKLEFFLITTIFMISGIAMKEVKNANANPVETWAQASPWGQVVSPITYTNPDNGQELCFYSSSLWAPCPGEGIKIIFVPGGKCYGSIETQSLMDRCPKAQCSLYNSGILSRSETLIENEDNKTPPIVKVYHN